MKIFDVVQVVGPKTISSYTPNSRTLIEFSDRREIAEQRCELFNEKRTFFECGHHFVVEEHDECSPDRANP